MHWLLAYVVTTAVPMILIGITAKVRGDFPVDARGRWIVSGVAVIPVLNLVYGIVIFLFYREPQGFI